MRVAFDVTSSAKAHRGGIGGYSVSLLRAMAAVAPHVELVPAVRLSRWRDRMLAADLVPGVTPRPLLDHFHRLTLGGPVDVLHALGARLPPGGNMLKVVTIHDLNVFEQPDLALPHWRDQRQVRLRRAASRADAVISDSRQGAASLHEHLQLPPEQVHVVPLGVDAQRFRPHAPDELAAVRAKASPDGRPYLLALGSDVRRKNHAGLIRAFARAGLASSRRLVIGGPKGDAADELRRLTREVGLGDDDVHLPGWTDDDELPQLVAGAEIYVCASWHEGFGLPVLEAQASGVPVACSDRAALPESLGEVGELFDPGDEQAFAECLRRLADDPERQAELSSQGPHRVAEGFTWEVVARRTLQVYEDCLAGRR